jgi:tripartite-type tricarboxylate transporter receptor subunit TctC
LPEVPTISEDGVPGFDYPIWYGIWVPSGTPSRVVEKLGNDIARALASPDLLAQLAKHGAGPMSMTQAEFAQFVLRESKNAARIMKASAVKTSIKPISKVAR